MRHGIRGYRALPVVGALLLAAAAHAQAPGGPGGFQPSPQMMAKFQAWQRWRDSHKNITALQQTLRGMQEMQQDPRTQLTRAQASKILPVLTKWRNKPVMSDAQARQVNQQITAPLSVPQLKKLASVSAQRGGRPGGFGGGFGGGRPGGGPGGPGGPRPGGFGGGRPGGPGGFTMPDPHDYNPLNPNTLPFQRMRPRAQQQIDGLIASLAHAR